jgi:hypothetical protein
VRESKRTLALEAMVKESKCDCEGDGDSFLGRVEGEEGGARETRTGSWGEGEGDLALEARVREFRTSSGSGLRLCLAFENSAFCLVFEMKGS